MRTWWFTIAVILGPAALSAQEVSNSCLVCHKDALSLRSWTVATLELRLRELVADPSAHPMPLPELDQDALRALATALADGE